MRPFTLIATLLLATALPATLANAQATPAAEPAGTVDLAPLRIDGARLMREQRAAQRQGKK